ncbi:MAG: VanZ family protein [Deltaproteobacteria bacterium]|nr:VanZ family protein [Deltaproteobacteria bacterium]
MMSRIYNMLYYWLPVCLYCLLIFIQSANPAPDLIPRLPFMDKVIHLGAYAVLGVLFFRAFDSTTLKQYRLVVPILAAMAASLYGISDEIHQAYVPFREADGWDALADIIGSIAGVSLVYLYFSKYRKQAEEIP